MSNVFASLLKAFRVRSSPSGFPGGAQHINNSNADLSCDEQGNLWVREAIGPSSGGLGFTYQAVPGDDAAVIQAVPAILTQIGGFNDSAATMYVQVHNRIIVPIIGDAPVMTFLVPAGASFSWQPSKGGRQFSTGISFGVSSTRDTYTALVTSIFLYAEGYIS